MNSNLLSTAMDWSTIVVAIASGISTGLLTALITPWAQWAVDMRRDRRRSRQELIEYWRKMIRDYDDVRLLTNEVHFPALARCLPSSSKKELSRLLTECDNQWEQFQVNELPNLEQKANSLFPGNARPLNPSESPEYKRKMYIRSHIEPVKRNLSRGC